MDYLKEAFQRVKQDILFLKQELEDLKSNMVEIKQLLEKSTSTYPNFEQKSALNTSTDRHTIPTHLTDSSTHKASFEGLKAQNLPISTGNHGASTDRQTDRQTDRHTPISYGKTEDSMENALDVLNSLDNIKKSMRLKFKKLTEQEFLVFSTIYQLDEEIGYSDYKLLSERLNLTESSIRDYVGRIIKKGISVDKTKINNKYIKLNVSEKLKKIVSLPTILQLREL